MNIYLVKVAVLLAVMSFIFCTEDLDSTAASEESGSTDFPKQPVFFSATLDDQKNIFDCIQREINDPKTEAAKILSNYTWVFCENATTFATIACNQTNKVLVNMTDPEVDTLFKLVLNCETKLEVTLPPTPTPPAC
uniref:Putative secreted salivary gland peptide n=1 Tax=Ixodes scapularis TaxID=6945 RepID=Q5Q994_IXOSC|nr:putative secreted salivary gland peptide [Ixodes scapularis]